MSNEKSKEGLAEIYEKEYMKTAMGVTEESKEKKLEDEIAGMFKTLCHKLDSLSNFHFTPKPAVHEVEVKASVPAIEMEEVSVWMVGRLAEAFVQWFA